ncbi:ubiquitin-specific protease ubp15 [Coemansia sp. RSA 2607]|nr:ubiquitin-specific protease ubp15 [Coemansia sp. RSA 2607]
MDRFPEGEIDPLNQTESGAFDMRDSNGTPRTSPSPNSFGAENRTTDSALAGTVPRVPQAGISAIKEDEFFETALPLDPKLEEEGHGYFHWEISDWTQLPDRAISQTFTVAGRDWDILVFPRGNNVPETISLYIEYKPKEDEKETDWHTCATFSLAMSNIDNPDIIKHNTAHHRFIQDEADWGFTRFSPIRDFLTPIEETSPALIDQGRVRISAYVRVIKDPLGVLWHNFHNYDSRKVTGYVGLRNQGATCYMNSLLQSLYFTNEFRNAVYQIPTETDDPTKSVALALQRVFFNLQISNEPVDTTELTKSFGWDTMDSFMQHDVQEFNRVLQDSLETKMKGTVADGAIAKLFEGKMKSFIRCVNVDFESSRVENYYDISLNVKGCKTLRDSFANYCEVETLDGENKYMAEGHGLQDARKGVIFESFPPVLQLQLKRFEYDFMRDAMVKINDRHEFPPSIDLGEFLSEDADRSMSWKYVLHGVLVHSGDLHGGHYFGLLRPTTEDKWYKFDDDRVVPVSKDEVFEEYYGGEFPQHQRQQPPVPGMRIRPNSKRFTNAYMLVYIREALSHQVMCEGDAPVPQHLIKRIQEDKEEKERLSLESKRMASTVPVKVVSNREFEQCKGFDLCSFGQRQPADNPLFSARMPLSMTLGEFKMLYAEQTKRDPSRFRLWSMVNRVNKTVRCDIPLVGEDTLAQSLEKFREVRSSKGPEIRLYCEEFDESQMDADYLGRPMEHGLSMIHIKYLNLDQQTMDGIGNLYVRANEPVRNILPKLRSMVNLPPDTNITLYEEVKPSLIDKMDVSLTFTQAEIQNGDIICFQITPNPDMHLAVDTVEKYFAEYQNRICVRFVASPKQKDNALSAGVKGSDKESDGDDSNKEIMLTASSKSSYDEVAKWLAPQIGVRDPLKIRFTIVSLNGKMGQTVRRTPKTVLEDMLPSTVYMQPPINSSGLPEFTVMYEILEVNILEYENMRTVRVTYVGKTMRDEQQLEVLVPKSGVMQNLFEQVYSKVEKNLRGSQRPSLADMQSGEQPQSPKPFRLRFYASAYHRFNCELNGSEPISEIGQMSINDVVAELVTDNDSSGVVASAKPEDDSHMDTDTGDASDKSTGVDIEVFHFDGDLSRTHGVPFLFRVYPSEQWSDTWARLQHKLGLGEKELKNMGVVYGSRGTNNIARCRIIQGSVEKGSPRSTASLAANNGDGNDNAALIGSPQLKVETVANQETGAAETPLTTAMDTDNVYLWDLIQSMAGEEPAYDAKVPTTGTPSGFIGLNHVDRSQRHRGVFQERAIKIMG